MVRVSSPAGAVQAVQVGGEGVFVEFTYTLDPKVKKGRADSNQMVQIAPKRAQAAGRPIDCHDFILLVWRLADEQIARCKS